MDLNEKKKAIAAELSKRVRVCTQNVHYKSSDANEVIFDIAVANNTTDNFDDIRSRVNELYKGSPANLASTLNEIKEIENKIDDYADRLARNAEIGNVDVQKEIERKENNRFDKMARRFENDNKGILVISSDSDWI